ncbi:hypothetical protein ACJ73_03428 [Blastomyces percursus]|uniref:CCHC-type domain-containing protein n=1 Tax=Blastomyces percursus TaxID=1658174 RepID=A0A1J9RC19_9EURO|nr:hypothetical protein ACJ73_03428 [Blastomyces percursus]
MVTTLFTSHNSSAISRPRSRSTGKPLERSRLRSGMHLAGSRARIHPWVDRYSETSKFATREFLELLKSTFADSAREQKALDRLNRLKQGKRSFDELLAELEQLLLEAARHEWGDPIKKGYLKGAFNRELKRHLLSLEERAFYNGFKDQVKRVADRVEGFARSERSQLSWRRNASPKRPWGSLPRTSPDPPDVMEWAPTPARAAEDKKTQRAVRVSPKALEKRKERGLCFRCGASGHIVTGCPYKPARRPAKVASAAPCWNLIKAVLGLGRERVAQAAATENFECFDRLNAP